MSVNAIMKTQPFIVTPKDYDSALHVLGTKVTVARVKRSDAIL